MSPFRLKQKTVKPDSCSAGPPWKDELLSRLGNDRRYKEKLGNIRTWNEVPISTYECLAEKRKYGPYLKAKPVLTYFSSGSSGNVKQVDYSKEDWSHTVAHRADCLRHLGLTSEDTVGIVLPFGPWFSGDCLSDACLAVGAKVLPGGMSPAHVPGLTSLFDKTGVNTIITTPSLALSLRCHQLSAKGIKRLILVGEHVSKRLKAKLEEYYGITPVSMYAASEAIIGYEDQQKPGWYCCDPERIYLEVLDEYGRIVSNGKGELLVTRRYGMATPLIRYRLEDLVQLYTDESGNQSCRFIGRVGHAFTLYSGVKIGRMHLDNFLDNLPGVVVKAFFEVKHFDNGRDSLNVTLHCLDPSELTAEKVQEEFINSSLEIMDVFSCGYLSLSVKIKDCNHFYSKRRIEIIEGPWKL